MHIGEKYKKRRNYLQESVINPFDLLFTKTFLVKGELMLSGTSSLLLVITHWHFKNANKAISTTITQKCIGKRAY